MPSPSPPTDASMGHAAHVEYVDPATEEEDWDSDNGSLQWEDFFGSSLELVPILLDMYDNLMAKNRDQDEPTNNTRPALSGCFNGLSRSRKNNASSPARNNGEEQLELIQYEASPQRTKGRCRSVKNICVDSDAKQEMGDGAGSTASLAQYSDSSKATDSGYIEDLPANQWGNEKRRPLSVTSTSSSASSSSSLTRNHCNKKSYLASIESLNDADLSGEDDEYAGRSRNGDGMVKSYPGSSANGSVPSTPRPKMCCDPSLTYIDRVVLEIVESERTYVTDINEIIEGYVGFVRNRSDLAISEDDVRDLFGNIEAIYIFNRGLLQELEQCGLDPVQIAQCFVQHNEGFSIYTHYCTNYPRTVSVLTDLMRKKETAEVFRERQAALGHTLPLGSFLLKPVQRILKYHLLLQNIVKHYDTSQVGYDVIVNALASMTGMAHHINDMKRKHEHAVRVQEIQSLLFGWEGADLTTFGELVAEGMFRIYGAKAVRHVFLFDKMLLIAKKKEGGYLSYKTHIMCSNLMLIESIPGEPLCFHVIPFDNPRIQYTLQARSLEQKREWTLQLKRVILENYHAVIPYHARQLVMQLGQNRPEDELLAEKSNNSKRQHSAPEYLEKRKQERGRRKSESGLNRALRMRKGSKKLDLDCPSSATCEDTKSRSRSSSHDGLIDKLRTRPLPDVIITSPRCEKKRREKLFKGWRRKSEPGDVTSSKESLTFSPVRENTIMQTSLPTSPTNTTTTSKTETSSYLNALSVIEAFLRPDGHSKEETTDTENEEHSVERKRMVNRGGIHIDEDDPSSDYVTFFFTQQHMQQVASSLRCNKNSSSQSSSSVEYNANVGVSSKDASIKSSESSLGGPSTSHYDNVMNIWTNMNWLNLEKEKAREISNESLPATPKAKMSLRRAQSFNSQGTSNAESQGVNVVRRSLRMPRPTRLELAGTPSFPVSPCYDRNLRLKTATNEKSEGGGNKKSGSLPRSFPLIGGYDPWICHGSSMESSLQELDDSNAGKLKTRLNGERPFTIASEKATHSFLNLEDFERYIDHTAQTQRRGSFRFPVQSEESDRGNTTECTSTPGESLEDITDTIHPEHKIYRSALSKASLKNVLSNVSSRLAHLKSSTSVHSDTSSCSNFTSDIEDAMQTRGREKERVSRRLMCSMAKVYTKVMKQHLRRSKSDEKDAGSPFSPSRLSLPMYRQGSPAIGARMASPIDTGEYSVPRHRKMTRKSEEMRPDSVLSVSSNITSSSDGDKTSGFGGSVDTTATPCESTYNLQMLEDSKSAKDGGESDSDGSADSYYERSFEAIEGLLDNELFRDSAIYSDPEESAENCLINTASDRYHGLNMPPPRPRKPSKNYEEKRSYSAATTPELESRETLGGHRRRVRGMTIMEKLKHLEDAARYRKDDGTVNADGFKSIEQRRKDLELWQHAGNHRDADESETSSQHSTSTVNTVVEMSLDTSPCSPGANQTSMKGWVKHIVGRFQEKTKPETCIQTTNRLN